MRNYLTLFLLMFSSILFAQDVIVKKDGSIDDVELLKSSGNTLLDQEALRLINDDDMPQWIPATQFSEAEGAYIKVDCRFVMPIVFKLENLPTCANPE